MKTRITPQIVFPWIYFFMISCSQQPPKAEEVATYTDGSPSGKLEKLDWLIGSWENIGTDGQLYEVWTRVSDTLYSGHGFMIVEGDTVFSEKIALAQRNDDLYYIPTVSDQNDGQPVSFRLVSDYNGAFVFENPDHDFPQRIVYHQPHPDSLHAWIEGMVEGEKKREDFFLVKSN